MKPDLEEETHYTIITCAPPSSQPQQNDNLTKKRGLKILALFHFLLQRGYRNTMIVDVGSGHTRLKIIHPYTNINATFISSAPVKT